MSNGSGLMTSQKARRPHLAKVTGEVGDLRRDVEEEFSTLAAMVVEEFTNLAVADDDAFVTSVASAATVQTYSGAGLDGVVGAGTLSPPRNVNIVTNVNADIDAVAVVVDGLDINGNVIQDTITLTDGGTVAGDPGVLAFASITLVTIPAQAGAGGLVEVGFGEIVGLAKPIKKRAGLSSLLHEVAIGVAVTTGSVGDVEGSPPNGTYEPAAVPNDTNDYAVYYEADMTP